MVKQRRLRHTIVSKNFKPSSDHVVFGHVHGDSNSYRTLLNDSLQDFGGVRLTLTESGPLIDGDALMQSVGIQYPREKKICRLSPTRE